MNLCGIRSVTMAGGLIAGLSFTLSVFAPNIDILIFTYGVLGGKLIDLILNYQVVLLLIFNNI